MPEIVHYSEGRLVTDGGQNVPDTAVTPTGTYVPAPSGGSNGQILTKDSTVTPQGVAWTTVPATTNIDGGTASATYTGSTLDINGGNA